MKQTAQETLDKGKEKLDDVQADRAADKLLRDLGAWYYASQTGRDNGEAGANVARIIAELQAHEAEHGELGKDKEPEPPAPAAAAAPPATEPVPSAQDAGAVAQPPPPPAAAPPVAPAPPVTAGPPPAPVTDGPPPPPA